MTGRYYFTENLNGDVFRQGLEPDAVGLNNSDGHVSGLARIDITHHARFAGVCASDNGAASAVFYFGAWESGFFLLFHFSFTNKNPRLFLGLLSYSPLTSFS